MTAPCAIHVGGGAITLKENPFGKDVANLALYRALAQFTPGDEINFLFNNQVDPGELGAALFGEGSPPKRLGATSIFNFDAIAKAGSLFVGKADLEDLGWLRQQQGETAWSITGLVHSLAPLAMRAYTARMLTSPLQPWDALICTSPVVKQAVDEMFAECSDYLASRFGGGDGLRAPVPQTPLIPLGVDLDSFIRATDVPGQRDHLRQRLGIEKDHFAAIWVGRLSFFEKAYPQSMFQALEETARRTGKTVHLILVGWFPGGERDRQMYDQAREIHGPNVRTHYLNGNDRQLVTRIWSAADCFVSLVDNIQETFGITPIEAMAAGLPVVVSDWDGYRYTVEDGVQGFRIPTLLPPPGRGELINLRHAMTVDSYQRYAATVAIHTAVDVSAAAEAFIALANDETLRRRMGEAGRARIRTTFNWPVVIAQMTDLWAELGRMRGVGGTYESKPAPRFNPAKNDPFHDFRHFPTHSMTDGTLFQRNPDATPERLRQLLQVALNTGMDMWRMSPANMERVLARIGTDTPLRVADLATAMPEIPRDYLDRTLVWMCKMGLLSWTPDNQSKTP